MGNMFAFLQLLVLDIENHFQEFLANAQVMQEYHARITEELFGHTVNQQY